MKNTIYQMIKLTSIAFMFMAISSQTILAQWVAQTSGITEQLNSAFFLDSDTGYTVSEWGIILKTTDGGSNWNPLVNPTFTSTLNQIYFVNNNTGYIAGRDHAGACNNGNRALIQKTVNNGSLWTCDTTFPFFDASFLNSLHFPSMNVGYGVGDGGWIRKTSDGGNNWDTIGGSGINGNSVFFTGASTGYIAGYDIVAKVFKTINGGANWTSQLTTSDMNDIYFTDANTGYMAGDSGTILKTSDAGVNWNPQVSNTTQDLYSVYFLDALNGYAVGDSGTILVTADSGANWNIDPIDSTNNLYSVHFPDANTGYAVGENGIILKRTFPVGVDEKTYTKEAKITIYPNPVSRGDMFLIQHPLKGAFEVKVFDIMGKTVYRAENQNAIPTDELSAGTYFIQLKFHHSVLTEKMSVIK